jgi:hypothetical protein
LYQNVPHWSASAGVLTSFLEKKIIGVTPEKVPGSTPGTQYFAVTDKAQVQLVPMAFVNYRIAPYGTSYYGKRKENQLVWTTYLSAGFGVNPNTGTNQPEFSLGLAVGLNHFNVASGYPFWAHGKSGRRVQFEYGGPHRSDHSPALMELSRGVFHRL